MSPTEFERPYLVTAGYVGRPGERTFFVQAEGDQGRVSLLVEKEQVAALGEAIARLLADLDDAPATDWDREAMALREPVEPLWRAGGIAVGMDPDRGRFLIELTELTEDEREPGRVRIWADHDQARRLAAHAAAVVAEGRPRCHLCGRPLAIGGHVCPATNGHGKLSR